MIYGLISSKQVIAKVLADLDLKEDSLRVNDMIEWCGEAIEKIGAVTQLTRKISGVEDSDVLKIKGHQARLPKDLFRLNQVAYATSETGPWFPMTMSTGNFNMWSSSLNSTNNATIGEISNVSLLEIVKVLYGKYVEDPVYSWFSKMDYKTALDILNSNENARVMLTNLVKASGSSNGSGKNSGLKYSIKPGYIVTNASDGFIKLSYDAMPTDEDGYPLVPDLISYTEACFYYIVMKLKYPEYLSGKLNPNIYYDIKRSWNFYCKQAYGDAMMPDQGQLAAIGKVWNKLVPDLRTSIDFDSDMAYGNMKNYNMPDGGLSDDTFVILENNNLLNS